MNHSGDAAEQVIRISLEGAEFAIRITGAAAKNIAAFLLAAFKSDGADGKQKLRGKERMVNMLKSGKETKIFAIKNSDLKQFAIEAKRYGVTYCVLKDKNGPPESLVEIMVTDADAGKMSRIMDKLEFAAVDIAALEVTPAEREAIDRDDTDKLLDALIDADGKAKTDTPEADKAKAAAERGQPQNPTEAGAAKDSQSEPRSTTLSESEKDTPATTKKPKSVKKFLRERVVQAAKKREEKQAERAEPDKKPKDQQKPNQHKQPQRAAKKKTKPKER